MNKLDKQYTDLLQDILGNGVVLRPKDFVLKNYQSRPIIKEPLLS